VTESEWLGGQIPKMLRYARSNATMRQRRLLACGFCRANWSQIPDERLKQFVELIERYADGKSGGGTLVRAYKLFGVVKEPPVAEALDPDMLRALRAAQASNEDPPGTAFPRWREGDLQVALLQDILGNPFRLAVLDPAWIAWQGGTIPRLAEAIYQERAFDRLPVLADALEEAGCTDREVLEHCRGPGPHVRGCWVLDLVRSVD
jgi:hypothetical protein